jgi:hypothetical protein
MESMGVMGYGLVCNSVRSNSCVSHLDWGLAGVLRVN